MLTELIEKLKEEIQAYTVKSGQALYFYQDLEILNEKLQRINHEIDRLMFDKDLRQIKIQEKLDIVRKIKEIKNGLGEVRMERLGHGLISNNLIKQLENELKLAGVL